MNEFSDHAPLFFSFTNEKIRQSAFLNQDEPVTEDKIFWDPTKESIFLDRLTENYNDLLDIENSELSINDKIKKFSNFLSENSKHVFGKTIKVKNTGEGGKKSPWFNEDCKNAQKSFVKVRNVFLKNKNDSNRRDFVKSRTKYNRIKRKAKKAHKIMEGQKLNDYAKKQPKNFWKRIKSLRKNKNKKGENLKMDDFARAL